MAEDTKNELVPVADYEVLDQVDDQAIVEMMTGQSIQDYVYSFKQGGKTVEGLTLAGINEAANRRGGIQVDDVQYEEREHSWLATAKATDTVTGSSRYGAYEQPKRMGNREDPHAFTKAIHKAQRNAVKQLLPVTVIKEVLNFYLHRQAGRRNGSDGVTERSGDQPRFLTRRKPRFRWLPSWKANWKNRASQSPIFGTMSNVVTPLNPVTI